MKLTTPILLALAVMLVVNLDAAAQNILTDRIAWTVSADRDLATDQTFSTSMIVTSIGTDHIELMTGNYTQTFQVVSVSGGWWNIAADGFVTYHVTLFGQPGQMTFERNTTGTHILVDMRAADPDGLYRRYTVTSTQVIE